MKKKRITPQSEILNDAGILSKIKRHTRKTKSEIFYASDTGNYVIYE